MFRKSSILLLLLCTATLLTAQVTRKDANKRAMNWYNKADEAFMAQDRKAAESHLLKALSAEPQFIDAMIRLGELYYMEKKLDQAAKYLEDATLLWPDYHWSAWYTLGRVYREMEEFTMAEEAFTEYLKAPKMAESRRKEVERMIIGCRFAKHALDNPITFEPENMGGGINTPDHEYLPTLTADEQMLFFTRREGMMEDIWFSKREDYIVDTTSEVFWHPAENLGPPVNTGRHGEGSQAISPDGKTLYFAADYGYGGKPGWDLYESRLGPEGWTRPVILPMPINTMQYESQPAISANGRSLYFVSRRPGGQGGKDIWVTHLQEDCTWGDPENLGPTINTEGDEEVPFIHPDGETLYFGSDGHPGLGGSDLFFSRLDVANNWSEPVNLGYPINSPDNEGSMFVTTDGSRGYFASDKLGGEGGYDIYTFEVPEEIKPGPATWVRVFVRDAETKEKLSADFELFDLSLGRLMANSKCQQYLKEDFLIVLPAGKEYALNLEAPGYLFHSAHLNIPETDTYVPEVRTIYLHRIQAGKTLVLNNIHFATGEAVLTASAFHELVKLGDFMRNNPTLRVEISGHTDNVGGAEFNQRLSTQRANVVREYLVEQGIEPQRMTTKGFGQSAPVDTNDTETGRSKNRRTEIRIL